MAERETKQKIIEALKAFGTQSLIDSALNLFDTLGYHSTKRLRLKPNTAEAFASQVATQPPLNRKQALIDEWESVDFLFQLTDEEIRTASSTLFESKGKWNGAVMESYLFFAIALKKSSYSRTDLSAITRAINRSFRQPAMLLFRHGPTLTLSVINRRLHKREESRDVLEKVTLIKDIRVTNPHRAHMSSQNENVRFHQSRNVRFFGRWRSEMLRQSR